MSGHPAECLCPECRAARTAAGYDEAALVTAEEAEQEALEQRVRSLVKEPLDKKPWRTWPTLRMTDDERANILARLKADRERRDGKPEVSEEMIRRDVEASMRLAEDDPT